VTAAVWGGGVLARIAQWVEVIGVQVFHTGGNISNGSLQFYEQEACRTPRLSHNRLFRLQNVTFSILYLLMFCNCVS
jgi:hypothetical protein